MESAQDKDDALVLTSVAGTAARLEIAGVGARSYAFIIDWHIRILAALLWLVGISFLLTGTTNLVIATANESDLVIWLVLAPPAAIYFLYHPVLECFGGTTPGKRYAGVRIVTRDGLVPGVGPILVRNLIRLIDSAPTFYVVGLVIAMVDDRARRLGDMAAGTLLVRAEQKTADVFADLSARSGSTLDPGMADLAQDLLARWEALEPVRRQTLATRVLDSAGAAPADGDAELRAALRALLGTRS